MSIRDAVFEIPENVGVSYLRDYYSPKYSGAHFESVDSDNNPHDRITGSDLYAVTMLQTPVKRKAGVGILFTDADEISQLLREIPNDPIYTLSAAEFEETLGRDSAAMMLWSVLFRQEGVGETIASKILARKRPHLIPIYDRVVKRVIKQQRGENEWHLWWEALTTDVSLVERAETLREEIKRPELSVLRILDVLLWYSGTYGIHAK